MSGDIVQRLQAQGVKVDTAELDLTPVMVALLERLEANKRCTTALPAADSSVASVDPDDCCTCSDSESAKSLAAPGGSG